VCETTVTAAAPRFSMPITPGTTSVAPVFVIVAVWTSDWAGSVSVRLAVMSTARFGTSVGGAIVRAGRVQPEPRTLRSCDEMSILSARMPQ
jgi:hypothetical protein